MNPFRRLLSPPPPALALEFTEHGIAVLRSGRPLRHEFVEIPDGTIRLSPVDVNISSVELLQSKLSFVRAASVQRAVLILPDFSTRVALLPFDELPKTDEERLSLLRFRLRRAVPFDIDESRIAYHMQPARQGKGHEVVVVAVSQTVLSQYEGVARSLNLQPGCVTVSTVAALNLLPLQGTVVFLRLSGHVLSVAVLQNGHLRVFRCVPLAALEIYEVEEILYPTVAYIEDELKSHVDRLILCGFGPAPDALLESWRRQYPGTPAGNLQSSLLSVSDHNAGAAGYFQSMEAA
jgi:type IV pilus assembly protein PilM